MKTAVYLRVSSALQASKGTIESQRMAAQDWLDRNGVEGAEWFEDDGVTGKRMDRPQFDEMTRRVRAGEFGRVVTMELSRVGRSAVGVIKWVREMVDRKVVIVCVREGVDFSTPMGRFVATLLAGLYELELETSGARRKDGIRRYIAEKGSWGRRSVIPADRVPELEEMFGHKWSLNYIAEKTGLPYQSIKRLRAKWTAARVVDNSVDNSAGVKI